MTTLGRLKAWTFVGMSTEKRIASRAGEPRKFVNLNALRLSRDSREAREQLLCCKVKVWTLDLQQAKPAERTLNRKRSG